MFHFYRVQTEITAISHLNATNIEFSSRTMIVVHSSRVRALFYEGVALKWMDDIWEISCYTTICNRFCHTIRQPLFPNGTCREFFSLMLFVDDRLGSNRKKKQNVNSNRIYTEEVKWIDALSEFVYQRKDIFIRPYSFLFASNHQLSGTSYCLCY